MEYILWEHLCLRPRIVTIILGSQFRVDRQDFIDVIDTIILFIFIINLSPRLLWPLDTTFLTFTDIYVYKYLRSWKVNGSADVDPGSRVEGLRDVAGHARP